MSTSPGACVARARLHARFGSPIPTNTISSSRSSRAATTVIISSAEYVASVAVVHSRAEHLARSETRGESFVQREVLAAVPRTHDVFVQIARERRRIARDLLPGHVEIVVAVVVPLRVR